MDHSWQSSSCTYGGYGLYEFPLFQLEEDACFARVLQAQSHHPHLHLWTYVHSIVLWEKQMHRCINIQEKQGGNHCLFP